MQVLSLIATELGGEDAQKDALGKTGESFFKHGKLLSPNTKKIFGRVKKVVCFLFFSEYPVACYEGSEH